MITEISYRTKRLLGGLRILFNLAVFGIITTGINPDSRPCNWLFCFNHNKNFIPFEIKGFNKS